MTKQEQLHALTSIIGIVVHRKPMITQRIVEQFYDTLRALREDLREAIAADDAIAQGVQNAIAMETSTPENSFLDDVELVPHDVVVPPTDQTEPVKPAKRKKSAEE